LLICFGVVGGLQAASLTVSPASGQQGARIRLSADRLSPNVTYNLQYFDTAATAIASVSSDAMGKISTSVTLPILPAGVGVLRLMRPLQTLPAASARFNALANLTATFPSPVIAGQRIGFEVNGLRPGSLTVHYDGELIFGPVTVSSTRYRGKLLIPRDRPAVLPANVGIVVRNRLGLREINSLSLSLAVRPPAIRPFAIVPTQAPPSALRPNGRFPFAGNINLEPNEAAPTQVSTWFFGNNGDVYPLSAAQVQRSGNQFSFNSNARMGTKFGMTAGAASNGQVRIMGQGNDTQGATSVGQTATTYTPTSPYEWRFKVRLRNLSNQPIAGAIVLFDKAPILENPDSSSSNPLGLISVLEASSFQIFGSQIPATDARGCPLTLQRRLTNAQGEVNFVLDDELLGAAQIDSYAGSTGIDIFQIPLGLGIDASAQCYGDVDPNFGYRPRLYETSFSGAGEDPSVAQIQVKLQGQLILNVASRSATLTVQLPVITPRVALYDTSMVPTLGYKTVGNTLNTTLRFGPIHNRVQFPPSVAVGQIVGEGYPTKIAVRTDPSVSGDIDRAELYLDVNRNNSQVLVNFTPAPTQPLDCSLDGLSTSRTWYANLPSPNFAGQAPGKIKGRVFFKGAIAAAGTVTQQIEIEIKQRDLRWLDQTDNSGARIYSNRTITMGDAGQGLEVNAQREKLDTDTQLPSNPGYSIGLLKSKTDHTELTQFKFNASQDQPLYSQQKLLGSNDMAGRSAGGSLAEASAGTSFTDRITLLDQSFPLFYYVWGIPLLAAVEMGANFAILAEIFIDFKIDEQLRTQLTTTPTIDMGLDFYLDLDVLFDLIDGGVDLFAGFQIAMPVRVVDGNVQTPAPTFDPLLIFSWSFDFFCLPLDLICDALNDIDGSEQLLPNQNRGNLPSRTRLFPVRRQQALAYSPNGGDGLMLQTSAPNSGSQAKLMAYEIDGADFARAGQVLSNAPGIRSLALIYTAERRALAVWAESSASYASLIALPVADRVARQHLMFALWDREDWTTKQALPTGAGTSFGVGGVSLAACQTVDCIRRGGEVLAVWTRGTSTLRQRRTQVFNAIFTNSAWSVPQSVDSAALLDSSPSAAYVGADHYVSFVRNTSGVFENTGARKVAYRNLRVGSVQVPASLPGGVAWPRIVALPAGGFAIAHTHVNDPLAYVGNTQRIALAVANSCTSGVCNVSAQPLTDSIGRPIYGERPTPMIDDGGSISVVLRGMGFGANPQGQQQQPDDPIGMLLHTGELVQMTVSIGQRNVSVQPLSIDGAGHLAPAVAFDRELGQIVVASQRSRLIPSKLRAQVKAAGFEKAYARGAEHRWGGEGGGKESAGAGDDIAIFTSESGLDLKIESVAVANGAWIGGNATTARVVVRNAGTPYTDTLRPWKLRLSLDAPYTSARQRLGIQDVALLASGQAISTSFAFNWPADVKPDQRRTLYAELYRATANDDVNDANNIATLERGGMPKVYGLGGAAIDRSNFIALGWELPVEANANLIAGYRIWFHDGDGNFKHLGSSRNTGFLDLSAEPGKLRTYRVTSYSANAVESEPSEAFETRGFLSDAILKNGFE